METDELNDGDVLGDMTRDAARVLVPLALLIFAPVVLLLSAFGGLPQATRTTAASSLLADIPADQIEAMRQESLRTSIPWQVFAAIAKVESEFGRNMATSSAGAVGYGQFLPDTWAAYGNGGDPYDFRDVIPAMGRLLLANGAPADLPRAIYAYNHLWSYVDKVLAYAAGYGYVHPVSLPARAVQLARSSIGVPYAEGADGTEAFDSAGLVIWIYGQLGLHVPWTAQLQFDWAVPIEPAQLQTGDLVFYGELASFDSIAHVGVYTGGGTVVMASAVGGFVQEVPLSDHQWSPLFAGAGRPPYWEVPV